MLSTKTQRLSKNRHYDIMRGAGQMRYAEENGNRKRVEAGPGAPPEACCPKCGWPVTLRHRRTMDDSETWFWRHKRNGPPNCPLRCHLTWG